MKNKSEVRGLNINKKKKNLMVFSQSRSVPIYNISFDNKKIKQIPEFEYLGSMLTSNIKCEKDIKQRVASANKNFIEKKCIFMNSKISIEMRKQDSYMHHSETSEIFWTYNKGK